MKGIAYKGGGEPGSNSHSALIFSIGTLQGLQQPLHRLEEKGRQLSVGLPREVTLRRILEVAILLLAAEGDSFPS